MQTSNGSGAGSPSGSEHELQEESKQLPAVPEIVEMSVSKEQAEGAHVTIYDSLSDIVISFKSFVMSYAKRLQSIPQS